MRPPGQIRTAALDAAWRVIRARGDAPVCGATWRDVEALLVPQGVASSAVRWTWKNLARDGALRPVGSVRVSDSSRALVAYVPTVHTPAAPEPARELGGFMRAWVAAR